MRPSAAVSSCTSPANAIEAENCLPGTSSSAWDLPNGDAGDLTIQGFASNISYNQGETVNFKVNTPAKSWSMNIYRMGYYSGNGARFITTVNPSVSLPQTQPACKTDSTAGLTDCGNWAVSASWTVPANATSGIYFAKLIRSDTDGSSHIFFIVRNDASHSDILFQTSDTTWQAYNNYAGQDFYQGPFCNGSYCRSYKLSYNRPFYTRTVEPQTWVFNAEYPMVLWLESNGYDVSYFTATDTDRNGSLITNHKVWMSNGHDEYWSGNERTNVETARAAGTHLAFFSGNSIYWKTRWENSIDGSGTPNRTLVCYKETWANGVIDPTNPSIWTGTWRDPRFSPPADGGRPENALAGTLTRIAGAYNGAITVPQADGQMRFWRNTSIASLSPGTTTTLAPGTLGEELDMDEDNGSRPAGVFHLATTPVTSTGNCLFDYGSVVGNCTTTHNMTMYRYAGKSLVFAAGTYDWAWGLNADHDRGSLGSTTDPRMQQATVNLFADMGVQPATLQPGLTAATASTDLTPPTSVISSPASGLSFAVGSTVTISGTASDSGGGVVAGVEVSTDGGVTWHPATGRASWTYTWLPTLAGPTNILSRAVDDSGNIESPSAGANVTVTGTSLYTIWPVTTVLWSADSGPDSSVEIGVKFRSDVNGSIKGIRFYKASTNTGTHVGNLWSSTGALLASATFANETASGWQQVNFSSPVAITANTIYIASYHANAGHYAANVGDLTGNGINSPPLHALGDGVSGSDGVYAYGSTSVFPSQGFNGTNYWVDVAFNASSTVAPTLSSIAVTPANQTASPGATQQFTATGTYSDGTTQNITSQVTWSSSNTGVATISSAGVATAVASGSTTISATLSGITGNTSVSVQVLVLSITTSSLPSAALNTSYSTTLAATGGTSPYTWSISAGSLPTGLTLNATTGVISGTPTASGTFSFTVKVTDSASPAQTVTKALSINVVSQVTIWPSSTVPGVADAGPDSAVELGVKFRSDTNGFVNGIRFYKASTNTGTHVGNLWSSTGALLASATFTNETASGWQQVNFSSPVAITANTIYVASYHTTVGHYSDNLSYFASAGVDNPPLHALANGSSGFNGVYAYGSSSVFPSQGYNSSNYWVDVGFSPTTTPPPTLSSIAVTPANPSISTGVTQQFTATGTYSDGSTQNITSQVTWYSSSTTVATISSAGLASAASTGSTTISAALSGITGSTTLTVQATALAISTSSLSNGTLNVAYSETLAASGGTPPYTWSLSTGSLPTGLTLNATTGVISGTPTVSGTFSFTAKATDSGSPAQTATKALSITVVSQATIWTASTVPGVIDSGPDSAVELGVQFRSDVSGHIAGIRFYKASTNTGTHVGNLWSSTGTKLATATFTNETASGWQQVNFSTPVAITANTVYVASYHTTSGHYSDDQNYFASTGVDNPPLHALANGTSGSNGVFSYGSASSFPSNGWNSSNYWVDVIYQP